MREIKFRGKCVDNGEWVYGFYWFNVMSKTHWLTLNGWSTLGWNIEVIPETVGQYTGLKDKNGIEIYEGDILACGEGNVPTEIKWVQESCAYMAYNLKRKEYHLLNKYFERFIGEIIGNIHDNPEMLEVQQ